MRFFKCKECGMVVLPLGGDEDCQSAHRQELMANGNDEAAREKHVPRVCVDGSCVLVAVGSVEHPMLPAHYIEWICLETEQGHQLKILEPGMRPLVIFSLMDGDKPVRAYAYCNLHGLWKKEI